MPHKRNPIGSENMTGLARVIRGHMVTAYETSLSGTNVISLTHQLSAHHTRYDYSDRLHAQPFWKYRQEL